MQPLDLKTRQQVVMELAGALGITDLANVTRIVLRIEGVDWPSIRVDRHITTASGVRSVTQAYRLKPVLDDAPASQEKHHDA